MEGLLTQLRRRSICYLTTLIAVDEPAVGAYFQRFGFRHAKTYAWSELFLGQPLN